MLDNINETLKEQNKKIKGGIINADSVRLFLNNFYTLISEFFEGKQSSSIKCLNCEKVTERTESYLNLSVDVEQNTSLAYCLKKYISKGKEFFPLCNQIIFYFLNIFILKNWWKKKINSTVIIVIPYKKPRDSIIKF